MNWNRTIEVPLDSESDVIESKAFLEVDKITYIVVHKDIHGGADVNMVGYEGVDYPFRVKMPNLELARMIGEVLG